MNLIRTTTYFDPVVMHQLKSEALATRQPFYEILNSRLAQVLGLNFISKSHIQKKINFDEVFGTFDLGKKFKKVSRKDAYGDKF